MKLESYHFKLYSRQIEENNYELLYSHLKEVGETSKKIVMEKKIQDQTTLSEVAYLVGIAHDFGKGTTFFQLHLTKHRKTEKAWHGPISSIFGYYLVKEYFKIKGKYKSSIFKGRLPLYAWLTILRHHGDIKDILGTEGELERLKKLKEIIYSQVEDVKKHHLGELQTIYDLLSPFKVEVICFLNKIDQLLDEIEGEGEYIILSEELEDYFSILFLYSVLLDADKLSAANISYEEIMMRRQKWVFPMDLIDKYRKVRFKKENDEISQVRNKAYDEMILKLEKCINEKVFSIELPTGYGKTLGALSVAFKLRHYIKERDLIAPRIIYVLPFLSIVDQTVDVVAEILAEIAGTSTWEKLLKETDERKKKLLERVDSSLMLKHHHLADVVYRTEDEELEEDTERSLLLIEGWHSEIIITTFVQLFHSLITNRNRAARKFHNIVNSIIILDEIQSIPYEFWDLIRETLMCMAENYGCKIILVTATQPLIFGRSEITPLIEQPDKYFRYFNRVSYIVDLKEKNLEEFKNEVLQDILKSQNDLAVVVNTIRTSIELYDFIKDSLREIRGISPKVNKIGIAELDDIILVNLSTHIIPLHRKERIEVLKNRAGKRKVIITTQLIEAGVDISVDLIYRDLAPLDCLVQTAGRCNRHNERGEKGGVCKVVQLVRNGRKLWKIYDPILVNATEELFNNLNTLFNENSLPLMLSKYFQLIKKRGSTDESMKNIDNMKKLNFSDIGEFKLIKEERKIDLFIDLNKESRQLWEQYLSIKKLKNKLERRKQFLALRNRFLNYIISVYEDDANRFLVDAGLGYIDVSTGKNYDLETGFKPSEESHLII